MDQQPPVFNGNNTDGESLGSVTSSVNLSPVEPPVVNSNMPPVIPKSHVNRRALLITGSIGTVIAVVLIAALGFLLTKNTNNTNSSHSLGSYSSTSNPLSSVNGVSQLPVSTAQTLAVNGKLQVNKSLVLSPSTAPSTPVLGEIYYNSATNTPYYYNGSSFVSFTPTPTTVGGASGAISLGNGLSVNNNQLAVSSSLLQSVTNGLTPKVSSVQGQTGAINFTAGNGITIDGTTIGVDGATISSEVLGSLQAGNGISVSGGQITNTGVVALTSTGNSVRIIPEGNGIFDLEDSNGGSGGVTSISSNDNSLAVTNDGFGGYNVQIASNGVVSGTYGSAATVAILTINGSGQVTNASSVPIAINGNQITSGKVGNTYLNTDVALYDNSTSNFTGALQQGGYNVCTTNGNCVGVPGGSIGGSGTSGAIAMFTGLGYTIGNSALTQTSGNLTDSGNLNIQGTGGLTIGTGSATVSLKAAASGTPVFTLPSSVGMNGQCLITDGSGNLSFSSCLSGSSGGSGGVSSLNGMSGSLTITQGTGLSIANGTNSISFALANTTVAPNSYGSASSVATFTVNAQGQLIAAGNTQIALNGNQITSGTIGDAYLSSNVGLYNNTTSNFTGSLQQNGNSVCTTAGNCTGVAGGSVGGGGTNGVLPVFTGTGYTLGNSVLSESTGDLTDSGYLNIEGAGGLILGTGTATTAIKSSSTTTISFTLPASTGSSGQCLTTDGTGVLSFSGCLSGSGGGSGGVVSLNGLSGALSIAQGSSISITTGASSVSVGLASTGVSANSYGSASSVATFTVNAEGQLTAAGSTPIAIDGNQITSGTVGDAYLSSNVALYANATSNFTGALEQGGNNVCTTAGNCTGVAGGSIGGSGTSGDLALFTGSGYTIGNSSLTQSSGNLTASGNLTIQGTGGLTLGTGTSTTTILGSSTSAITFTLPSNTGSANQCLVTNGSGVLSFVTCVTGSGGGSGVTTLNGLSGSLSLQDSSGELTFSPSGSNISISLPQNLARTSSPTFASLTLTSPLSIANGGTGQSTAPTAGQLLIGQTGGTFGLGTLTQGTGLSIASASGSITVGLSNTAVTAASYGDGADVATFTVNAQGQLTTAGTTAIAINGNQVTSGTISNNRLNTDVALYDNVTSNFTGTLQQAGNNVCTTAGNCVGVSGGGIGGSGSAGSLAMFTGSGYTIGNSALTDTSGNITDSGNLEIQGSGGLTLGSGSSSTSLVSSATSGLTFTLPNSTGSNGQCLTTNGTGTLSFANCLSGSSGGSGGVSSLNGLSGAVTLGQGTGLSVSNGASSITVGLANTAVTGGSYGDGADVATFTVNAQGQLTAAGTVAIAINGNQITSGKVGNTYLNTDVALYDNVTSNFTGTLQQAGNNVCTTAGNCVGVSGGAVGGSGTAGTIALFTGSGFTVGNSVLTQASGNLTASGNLVVQGAGGLILGSASSTTALLSGSSSAISFTLPANTGSNGQCLTTNGTGALSFTNCLSGSSGGSGGVSSLNGLSGAVTLQDTSGLLTFTPSGQNVGITLATSGVTASSYGSASSVATFTVNSTGQLTAAGNTAIAINGSQITSGSVAAIQGGTGMTSYTQGSLLYASGTASLSQLNDVAAGQCLQSGGTTSAPVWGSCSSAGSITGSGTSGQVALFNGTNTLTGSSVLTQSSSLITDSGTLLVQTSTNNATALVVENSSGNAALAVSTVSQTVIVGNTSVGSTVVPFHTTVDASLTTGTAPEGDTSGNLCGNGKTDLAVANAGSGTISVFCNTGLSGTAAFSSAATETLTAGSGAEGIVSGNLCGNGKTDLASSNASTTTVSLFCNTGSTGSAAFSSTATTTLTVGSNPRSITSGNLCGNGKTDLAIANRGSSTVSLFCNTGSTGAAAFNTTATTTLTTGSNPDGIITGSNVCNNGLTDIVTANASGGSVSVFCNTGSTGAAAFSSTATETLSAAPGTDSVITGNFCGNGRTDIAVSNNGAASASLFCNTGSTGAAAFSGSVTKTLSAGSGPYGITTGNFCGNSRADLTVSNNSTTTVSVYCNTGSTGAAAFSGSATETITSGTNPNGSTVANLCNNNRADLAITNSGSTTTSLFCNLIPSSGLATSTLQVNTSAPGDAGIVITGASGQSVDNLDIYNNSNVLLDSISSSGDLCVAVAASCNGTNALQVNGSTLLKNQSNSTTAFQVQNTAGTNILSVDTANGAVIDNTPTMANNMLLNPGFELGSDGWTLGGSASIVTDSTGAHNGFNYLGTAGSTSVAQSKIFSVIPGQTYEISAWTKSSSGANGDPEIGVAEYNPVTATFNNVYNYFSGMSTTWGHITGTFTMPSGYTQAIFYLGNYSNTTGTWYFDDASVVEVSYNQQMLLQDSQNETNAFGVQNDSGVSVLDVDTSHSRVGIGTAAPSAKLDVETGSSNDVSLLANTSGTGNILELQKGGSNVVTVANTGATTFTNSTNSTAAFQIQNAGSAATIFNVDTTNQVVTINQGSTTSGWQTNPAPLPSGGSETGTFTYAGNLYEIISGTVYEAPISGNGSTGGWTAVSTFSGWDTYMSATVYNGYVYVFASDYLNNTAGCGGSPSKIYSAPITGGGVIGTWTMVDSGFDGYFGTLQAYNGYLYLSGLFNTLGGCGNAFAATDNTIWSIPIGSGGTLGSETANTWPANTGGAFTAIYNGYLYTFGGWGGSNSNTVIPTTYAAVINSGTGTLGSATSSTSLPTALWSNGASALPVYNGTVYVTGGATSGTVNSPVNTFYSASLNLATIGTWASGSTLPQALDSQGNVLYGSYLYSVGGFNGSKLTSVYYTSLSGTNTLLQVQNNGTNVITASNTGNLLIHPSIDSTGVFQVQNAAGSTEFDVDTQDGRIGIGTNSPGNLLSVGGLTTAAGTYQIAVSTNGSTNSGIVVQDVASQSSGYGFMLQNSSGTSLASIDYQGNLTVQNATVTGTLTVNGHIVTTNSSGTTSAAVQTNAGTSATCSVTGDDTDGTITLVTGTASWTSGAQCIISFGSSFTTAPHTVMSATGSTNGSSVIPTVIPSTGSFTVNFINADTAQHTYTWDFVNLH